jgi:hypothetical protein
MTQEPDLKHTPRKTLKRLAQETGMSKSSARRATQLLKLGPHCSRAIQWFLQSVVEGEIDPQLAFFSDESWFHLQGYINTQNNRYWSSQNPRVTREVPLYPLIVGVWCAVSARVIAGSMVFNETILKDIYM